MTLTKSLADLAHQRGELHQLRKPCFLFRVCPWAVTSWPAFGWPSCGRRIVFLTCARGLAGWQRLLAVGLDHQLKPEAKCHGSQEIHLLTVSLTELWSHRAGLFLCAPQSQLRSELGSEHTSFHISKPPFLNLCSFLERLNCAVLPFSSGLIQLDEKTPAQWWTPWSMRPWEKYIFWGRGVPMQRQGFLCTVWIDTFSCHTRWPILILSRRAGQMSCCELEFLLVLSYKSSTFFSWPLFDSHSTSDHNQCD